jgi:hypothetical protein
MDYPVFKQTPDGPRAWTQEEVRDEFIDHVNVLIQYWSDHDGSLKECLSGLVFSILTALDGESLAVPAFKVIPVSDPEDAEFLREEGSNWYPEDVDIAGALHDVFVRRERENSKES